jgi:hypothetical protein
LVNFFGQNQPNQGMLSLTSGHHTHTHTHTHTLVLDMQWHCT